MRGNNVYQVKLTKKLHETFRISDGIFRHALVFSVVGSRNRLYLQHHTRSVQVSGEEWLELSICTIINTDCVKFRRETLCNMSLLIQCSLLTISYI